MPPTAGAGANTALADAATLPQKVGNVRSKQLRRTRQSGSSILSGRMHPPSADAGRLGHDGVMSTIVFVHAHPDDEASSTAGSMARASDEGHRVVLVVATDGDHGVP